MGKQLQDLDDQKYGEPQLVALNTNNDDYQMVYSTFLESANFTNSEIETIFIYKVNNKHRDDAYLNKKKQILQLLNNDKSKLNEKALYHGTALETIIKILHQGFLRQFTARAAYGKGVYFARDASYSCNVNYSQPDNDEFQHVLLSNVICGEWTVGKSEMKIPPSKPNNQYIPFETTVIETQILRSLLFIKMIRQSLHI